MDIRAITNAVTPDMGTANRSAGTVEALAARLISASPETANPVEQARAIPSLAQVSQAVKNINKALESMAQSLEFTVDADSDRTVVKVVDQQTKQVIRQIPSEEAIEIARALDQAQGLLIKQKA